MKRIYIIAGEPSGELLGAGIIEKLRQAGIEIFGVGGDLMQTQGLHSLFNINEISVGGIFEVIPHLIRIRQLIKNTVEDIIEKQPEVLLTIDSPGFCFRVAKIVKKLNPKINIVHLVAPSVWAWRSNRAKRMVKFCDHLLTLFEFEPPFFTKYGLKATFVGHPSIEIFTESGNKKKTNTLLILPGSRSQEIKSLLPIFLKSSEMLNFKNIVIPTLPHLESLVRSIIGDRKIEITANENKKLELFKSAKCAIVASGTATLQLALSGCPMVVCYRLSPLSYRIVKSLIKVKFISLVNLISNHSIVPELIQSDCNPEKIAQAIKNLNFKEQTNSFRGLRSKLRAGSQNPTDAIAIILKNLMKRK